MRATAFLAVSVLSTALFGCGPAVELTGIICDCEHCNDWEEEGTLDSLQASADIADAYGCSDQWDDYMTCQIDNGTCDEVDANWSTRAPGSCSATMDLGNPCTMDADCTSGPGNGTCNATTMTCHVTSCTGGGGPCDSNADCPGGTDKCESQQDRLNSCVSSGSAHQNPNGP